MSNVRVWHPKTPAWRHGLWRHLGDPWPCCRNVAPVELPYTAGRPVHAFAVQLSCPLSDWTVDMTGQDTFRRAKCPRDQHHVTKTRSKHVLHTRAGRIHTGNLHIRRHTREPLLSTVLVVHLLSTYIGRRSPVSSDETRCVRRLGLMYALFVWKCGRHTQTARRDEKWFSASRPVRLHGPIRDEWPIPKVADVVEPSGNGPGGQHACRIEQNPPETCNDASRSEGLAGPVRLSLLCHSKSHGPDFVPF